MIIATAGHVDHGKTALVKALTGVDADRLPEEKKRGMSIDLGYAYLPLAGGQTLGFVDVPGHERFVHNMLCGLAGIDAVLFVVAADDGPMPQTREHLAILDLLGVRDGLVALTKTDRVAPERVAQVREEITQLTADTALAQMPVFALSAHTGEGIAAFRAHLLAMAAAHRPRAASGNFRLAVDRSFTLSGAGLIVTGTVFSGSIAAGSQAEALLAGKPARVRGIHAQNAAAESGHAEQRCALNLAGELKVAQIARGDWIVQGEVAPATARLDVRVRVPAGGRTLRHWTPVHAHLGAIDVTGRIAVLEGEVIAPGQEALAQLVLDAPVGAVHGDRLILRDQSARHTIAGGRVIDVYPPPRGRARPARLAALRAMEQVDAGSALAALLSCMDEGVHLERYARNRNLTAQEAAQLFAALPLRAAGGWAYAPARWAQLRQVVLDALALEHKRNPDAPGLIDSRLWAGTGVRLPREAAQALLEELLAEGRVRRSGSHWQLPGHQVQFNPADTALWSRIAGELRKQAARPPVSSEIATQIRETPARVQALLERAARRGLVCRVGDKRFFLPETVAHLAFITQAIAEQSPDHRVTPLLFREQSALGRNLSVEVLEFFDRAGYTRRIGEARLVLKPAREVFGGPA